MEARHIREVQFMTRLSNVVLVPNAVDKWRVCVDFQNLNKVYLKDYYHLSQIDQLVDSTFEHKLIPMLDAYQDYHKIPLT